MLPPFAHRYVQHGIAATPVVLDALLGHLGGDAPLWDARPDPGRFTLREVVAHLADWEPIWLDRLTRTLQEDEPALPGYDEGQVAIDHDYAHSDPVANLGRFREGRARIVEFVAALKDEEWARAAQREGLGRATIDAQIVLMLGHDGYHLRQVAEWLREK